jgi:O-succinylbenzoate synthase
LDAVELREIELRLKEPFVTSMGPQQQRRILLLRVEGGGQFGWGECVAREDPYYSYETVETATHVLERFLIPELLGRELEHPRVLAGRLQPVRGHPMAKAALEAACWELESRRQGLPLWRLLGGSRPTIESGVSLGIQPTPEALLDKIERERAAGYRRIKIKIKPGWDLEIVDRIRQRHPDLPLMVDANSAYRPADLERLAALDNYRLMMIEQPFAHDDLLEHAALQRVLRTPICLDESIRHAGDAALALELGSCRIINIKMGRVGGFGAALEIETLCRERGVPVWCGGMLETGIGRLHNVALATLAGFTLPGDIADSRRYYSHEIIDPPVAVAADGTIRAPDQPGTGHRVLDQAIDRITRWSRRYRSGD